MLLRKCYWCGETCPRTIDTLPKRKKRERRRQYTTIFKESGALALRSIGIDRETKLAVIKTLRVSNTDVVQQDDPGALEKVFHLVHAKIFSIIKFNNICRCFWYQRSLLH